MTARSMDAIRIENKSRIYILIRYSQFYQCTIVFLDLSLSISAEKSKNSYDTEIGSNWKIILSSSSTIFWIQKSKLLASSRRIIKAQI